MPGHEFLERALALARRGLFTAHPNPRVGCVLVRGGEIVGEGWHRAAGEAHAEVHALAAAGARARGATAYVSLEPCCHHGRTPPCTEALIRAGVARVVAAGRDPDPRVAGRGFERLREAGIEAGPADSPRLARAAADLNPGFFKRAAAGRPFVRLKLAMSLDGRTALPGGESRWITGQAARRDVQRWRARAGALLTGIGTVLADDPRLTIRPAELDLEDTGAGPEAPPDPDRLLRAVLDSRLRTPPGAALFASPAPVLIATAGGAARAAGDERTAALAGAGAEVAALGEGEDGEPAPRPAAPAPHRAEAVSRAVDPGALLRLLGNGRSTRCTSRAARPSRARSSPPATWTSCCSIAHRPSSAARPGLCSTCPLRRTWRPAPRSRSWTSRASAATSGCVRRSARPPPLC